MKTSNKILWGSFVGIFITSIIFLVLLRAFMTQPIESDDDTAGSNIIVSQEFDMSGFTGISIEGHWQAKLFQGDPTKIRVEGPEDLIEVLSVQMQDESLILRMAKQPKGERKLILTVTMPEMNRLQTKGVTNVTIEGFEMERLSVRAEGVSSVNGSESRIGFLDLRGRGVSRVELEKIPVGKAVLDYKGVFNIDLTMDGGELEGNIKGVGEVRYGGRTSRESIRQEGPCKVTHLSEANQV